jgi:hypothetical protein
MPDDAQSIQLKPPHKNKPQQLTSGQAVGVDVVVLNSRLTSVSSVRGKKAEADDKDFKRRRGNVTQRY